jgi:putative phage-type endonuclease
MTVTAIKQIGLSEYDKEIRKRRITGNRIGAIVGLSKYKAPIDVWLEIMGHEVDDISENPDVMRGTYLEDGLLQWYAAVTKAIVSGATSVVHPRDDRFAATPDGSAVLPSGQTVNLEVKVPRRFDDWGESGTDDIPKYHICQVTLEMACAGHELTHVVALIWGELRIYPIPRDRDLEAALLKRGADFWQQYIDTGIPPPPDGSRSYTDYLSEKFANPSSEIINVDDESINFDAEQILALRTQISDLEFQKLALQNKMCKQIGSSKGIKGRGWRALWSKCKSRKKIDWERYARVLGAHDEGAKNYLTQGDDYRRFDLRRTK